MSPFSRPWSSEHRISDPSVKATPQRTPNDITPRNPKPNASQTSLDGALTRQLLSPKLLAMNEASLNSFGSGGATQ
jgi:hypothetical protein